MRWCRNSKVTDLIPLHWFAVVASIAGAALLAMNLSWSRWAYPLFLIGSIILLVIAVQTNDTPDVLMWTVYTFFNVIGIWRWFTVKKPTMRISPKVVP